MAGCDRGELAFSVRYSKSSYSRASAGKRLLGCAGARSTLDAGTWTIAKERCKNGKAHTVDLHPEAVRLLDPLGDVAAPRRRRRGKAEYVFSTTVQRARRAGLRSRHASTRGCRKSSATSSSLGAFTI